MKQISPEKFVEGVNSIYIEQPKYRIGGDGSDGTCDCIGMGRGALEREGVEKEDIRGMNGTNYAARHTIKNMQKIKSITQLRLGDALLKVRDKDDKDYPLPDQYRKGGNDFVLQLGETNFTHIGWVTQTNPLRITHMTSPTAKIDTKIGNWKYFGQLPWINYGAEDEEMSDARMVTVWAEKGSTVKMRAKPSTLCRTYWDVPVGSEVVLTEPGDTWSGIIWSGRSGYMMTKFLKTGSDLPIYGVVINNLTRETAEELVKMYGGEITAG